MFTARLLWARLRLVLFVFVWDVGELLAHWGFPRVAWALHEWAADLLIKVARDSFALGMIDVSTMFETAARCRVYR